MSERRLIESDDFAFEFLSRLAERESWRKEIHRPVYHVHKWWAKRLGSVFRGILLGCVLPKDACLEDAFYQFHSFSRLSVLDPFMGSGTTIGEAHKLGFSALGRDINAVAVDAAATALGPMDRTNLKEGFQELDEQIGDRIRSLYQSRDSNGRSCDVLYHFWVMQACCPACGCQVDLFPSYVVARNAYPNRKPVVQVLCRACGDIFPSRYGQPASVCRSCSHEFDPSAGPAKGAHARCQSCGHRFAVLAAICAGGARPDYRLYGKLVLTRDDRKEYLPTTEEDRASYARCSQELSNDVNEHLLRGLELQLEHGYNTRQAMRYGFRAWRDFFNDRQLLALSWLRSSIQDIADQATQSALRTLFSGVLEFNNLFASYKGEGTGAVRHMFSHHILKPERTPIEANIWGTPRSSGSFSSLFERRLIRALEYRLAPTEVNGRRAPGRVCALPFTGRLETKWPTHGQFVPRGIYLSCGDSANIDLPDRCVDFVVTDPPFFDNVHYSELADFFQAWRSGAEGGRTTRHPGEVQDSDSQRFAEKLRDVFAECRRVLKDDGLMVFSYHHSRDEGWRSLAQAVYGAGFVVVNSHPVRAEMAVATPKAQAKEPIQLDILLICRKSANGACVPLPTVGQAIVAAREKLLRLRREGFHLSRNDRKVVLYGQALTAARVEADVDLAFAVIEKELATPEDRVVVRRPKQQKLFDEA